MAEPTIDPKDFSEIEQSVSDLSTSLSKLATSLSKLKTGAKDFSNYMSESDDVCSKLNKKLEKTNEEIDKINASRTTRISDLQNELSFRQEYYAMSGKITLKERFLLSTLGSKVRLYESINSMVKIYGQGLTVAKSLTDDILNNLTKQSRSYGYLTQFFSTFKGAAVGGRGYLAMLTASLNRWIELDETATDFRKNTGFLVSQTTDLNKAVRKVNVEMQHLGVGLKELYDAGSALSGEFQVIGLVTEEVIANTAMMAANLGLNVQDAAKFKGLFESIAQSVGSSGDSMIRSAAALADMAGVAPRAVLNDMANASEETLTFLAKSPMALMRATVEARRLGTTVNSLSKSARGFLNYQDSITSELEASALIGKSLNFQEARAAAYAGDVVKSRELALKQIEKAGDFTKLNVYQQEAIARAAGMTTSEIIKQQNQQKLLAKLEQSRPELYKKYMEMQKKIQENEKAAAADIDRQAEQMAKQALMQGEINKLTSALDSAWTNLSDALLPIANTILPIIIITVRSIGILFKLLGGFIKGMLSPLDNIFKKFRSGEDSAKKIEQFFSDFSAVVEKMVPYMIKIGKAFAYTYSLISAIWITANGIQYIYDATLVTIDKINKIIDKTKKTITNIKNGIDQIKAGVSGWVQNSEKIQNILQKTQNIFGNITDKVTGVFKGSEKIKNTWDGIKSFSGKTTQFISTASTKMQDFLKISERAKTVTDGISNTAGKIGKFFGDVTTGIKNAVNSSERLSKITGNIGRFASWTSDKFSSLGPTFEKIGNGASKLGKNLMSGIKIAFDFIKSLSTNKIGSSLISLGSSMISMFAPIKSVFGFVIKIFGVVSKFLGPIGVIINVITFVTSLIKRFSDMFESQEWQQAGFAKRIWMGIKAVAGAIYDTLIQPFVDAYNWIKNWLMGASPSKIGLGIVDGIKSVGGMLLDVLTWPFRTVVNFVSKIFGGDGSLGDSIINGIKSIMGGVFDVLVSLGSIVFTGIKNVVGGIFDILTSPFKSAFEFIKKIPFIGKMLGGGDASAAVNTEAKLNVEKQVAMAVEVKNLDELKETINKLVEAISKLGGTAGGASPVVNVNNNQNAMIEKLDELIGLLKDGAIAVNMDGVQVSRTLAKTS